MVLKTDYDRQLWTGLSTDDWGDVPIHEGDVAYLMDLGECYVFGENQVYQLPDLGGGGGVTLESGNLTTTIKNEKGRTENFSVLGLFKDNNVPYTGFPFLMNTGGATVSSGQTKTSTFSAAAIQNGLMVISLTSYHGDEAEFTDIKVDGVSVNATVFFTVHSTSSDTLYYSIPCEAGTHTVTMTISTPT